MKRITQAIKLTALVLAGSLCLMPCNGAWAQVQSPLAGMPPMVVQAITAGMAPSTAAVTLYPSAPEALLHPPMVISPTRTNPYVYANNNAYKYIDPSGLETATVSLGLPPFGSAQPTILESCVATCAGEMVSDTGVIQAISAVLASPIIKPIGLGGGRSSPVTNPISGMNTLIWGPNGPKNADWLGQSRILGSAKVCRSVGRLNVLGQAAYSGGELASCTASCVQQGGL